MSEFNKDENINKEDNKLSSKKESDQQNDEISIEEKLKNSRLRFPCTPFETDTCFLRRDSVGAD